MWLFADTMTCDYPKLARRILGAVMKDSELELAIASIVDIGEALLLLGQQLPAKGINVPAEVDSWRRVLRTETHCDNSRRLREKGNNYYKAGQVVEALKMYTKALNVLPMNSNDSDKERCLCLGNMSAAQYQIKDYPGALGSATLAITSKGSVGIDQEKRVKWKVRCEKCQQHLEFQQQHSDKNIDDILNKDASFRIDYNVLNGRHGRATRNINFGEVILVDSPIGAITKRDFLLCSYCLKEEDSQEVHFCSPFGYNNSRVHYCSLVCLLKAFNSYERYESRLNYDVMFPMSSLRQEEDCGFRQLSLALRLVLQQPQEYFTKKTATNCPLLVDYGSNTGLDNIDPYMSLESMLTHHSEETRKRLGLIINVLLLTQCLQSMDYLVPEIRWIGACLYHYLGAITTNGHTVYKRLDGDDTSKLTQIGSALYPRLPLLNHSCCPNTARVNCGGKVILVAAANIAEGDEVSDSYGVVHYLTKGREERRQALSKRYKFQCQCVACKENYPLAQELEVELCVDQVYDEYHTLENSQEAFLLEGNYAEAMASCCKSHKLLVDSGITRPHMRYEETVVRLTHIARSLYN